MDLAHLFSPTGGIYHAPDRIVVGPVPVVRAAAVNIVAALEYFASHMHLALKNKGAVVVVVLVSRLGIAGRELDEFIESL